MSSIYYVLLHLLSVCILYSFLSLFSVVSLRVLLHPSFFFLFLILFFLLISFFFFFNDTATTEIYTLSLHDALPISLVSSTHSGASARTARGLRKTYATDAVSQWRRFLPRPALPRRWQSRPERWATGDRKSTRLNSSHQIISYAVFCLKKKKNTGPS